MTSRIAGGGAELLLLRHAQSTWNERGLWQGQGDPPLSEAGRIEAAGCAARVGGHAPQLAVASDLQRALETARIIARRLALPLEVDPRWREWDVGEWSGHSREQVRARWPALYDAMHAGDPELTPPGGESRRALERRVRAAAADLAERHPGKRVLVVTHRGAILALLPESRPAHLELHRLAIEREQRAQHPADEE